MECAECMSTGQVCLDCQLHAAREEGRREGYSQGHSKGLECGREAEIQRTALQEAVLRAAAARAKAATSPAAIPYPNDPLTRATRVLDDAVDALLAAERAWGEAK